MWINGTSKHRRNPAKWKWHFPKALHSCRYKPFRISPRTHHVVWKAQAGGGWKRGVSAPWNSFPQQKDDKSWWWKQFDFLMSFPMLHGDLHRNGFSRRTPDTWDELGGCQNVQAQDISLQRSTDLRSLYSPVPGQVLQPTLHGSSLVTSSIWMFARVF